MTLLSLMTGFLLWMCCATHKASAGAACEDPPLIEFGKIVSGVKSEYEENDRVQYTCNPGYALSGSERVTCHGKVWMPGPPQCLERPCGSIPAVANAAFEGRSKEKYEPGETVRYQCHEGFQITGPPEIFCRRGNWSTPPICEGEGGKCGPPPDIENGDILSFQLKQYPQGATLKYKCASFYILKGPEQITCTDGQWTNPPVCLAACTASEEDMDRNNIMLKWSGESKLYLKSGDFVEFDCKIGYVQDPASSPFRVQCMDGTLEYPWCKPGKDCTVFETAMESNNIKLRQSRRRSYTYRSEEYILFTCKDSYHEVSNPEDFNAQCQDGVINYPRCENVTCEPPPEIAGGKVQGVKKPRYLPGEIAHYQCWQGFQMTGASTVTCQNGTWTERPQCKEILCSPPRVPNGNFRPQEDSYREGAVITIDCNPGYRLRTLSGKNTAQCTSRGWVPAPDCVEKPCDYPVIENGKISERMAHFYFPMRIGQYVDYHCRNGYLAPNGERVVRIFCSKGGWNPEPKCLMVCTASEEDMDRNNIELRWRGERKLYSTSGDFVEFDCKIGYVQDPASSPFRVQCMDGTLEYPRCKPGRNCSLSETAMERNNIKLRHSRRRSDIYRSKETISFTCYFLFREVSNPEDFDAQCQDGVINYPRCERTFG
ncbi:complement factor H-like isoform 2-T2 [Mergus octosetaceus]